MNKLHGVGRFLSPGCRGWYLRALARAWKVSIREISRRMGVPQTRVREVFNTTQAIPYGIACDYIEGITGNARVFSPVVAEIARRRSEALGGNTLKSYWESPTARQPNRRHAVT
jgi:hypothetical protein